MKRIAFMLTLAFSFMISAQTAIAQDPGRFCGGIVVFAIGLDSAYLHTGDVMLLPVYLILANPISRLDLHFKINESGLTPVFFVPSADLFSEKEALLFEMNPGDGGLYVSWSAPNENAYTLEGAFLKVGDVALQVDESDQGRLGESQFTLVSSGRTLSAVDSPSGQSPDPFDYLLLWPDNTDLDVVVVSNIFGPIFSISFEMPLRQSAKIEIWDNNNQPISKVVEGVIPQGRWRIFWNARDDDGVALANGAYFYQLTIGALTEPKKMLILR